MTQTQEIKAKLQAIRKRVEREQELAKVADATSAIAETLKQLVEAFNSLSGATVKTSNDNQSIGLLVPMDYNEVRVAKYQSDGQPVLIDYLNAGEKVATIKMEYKGGNFTSAKRI